MIELSESKYLKDIGNYVKTIIKLIRSEVGPEPKLGCEVGVWAGATSIPLLRSFPSLTLLMVDRYREYGPKEPGSKMRKKSREDMMSAMVSVVHNTMDFGDRRVMMVGNSVLAAFLLKKGLLDFAWIDAGHDYNTMKADVPAWNRIVRPGGLVGGHDYAGKGDKRGWFGVQRAVDEFAKLHGYNVGRIPRQRIWWLKR